MRNLLRNSFLLLLLTVALSGSAAGQPAPGTWDETIPPGANFDRAEFRLWIPTGLGSVKGTVVLVPGSNGDWRSMVQDTVWQQFATRNGLALVGVRLTDKPHEQSFIEEYVNVSRGSGQALLDALTAFSRAARHPELANAPLLLWGMSAGGQFNYEFVAWKPERVIAFVVNKGGIYYSALLPRAAREVPGILFTGSTDLAFRNNTINGLFAVNRRAGALWALADEPGVGHVIGRSRDVTITFFEEVLPLRLAGTQPRDGSAPALVTLAESSGFIGDLKEKTFQPLGSGRAPNYPTAWMPTERVARFWQAIVSETPFVR